VAERFFPLLTSEEHILYRANLEKPKQAVSPGTQLIMRMGATHTSCNGLIELKGSVSRGRGGVWSKIMIKSRVFPTVE
jgi:hypothetical protein